MAAVAPCKSRVIAIALSAVAIITNSLWAYLFHRLPDDPYHLALNSSAYSYFSLSLSVLGLVGALREHAFSVAVFANYLIIDTILCAIPRFVFLMVFSNVWQSICVPTSQGQRQVGRLPQPSQTATYSVPTDQQTGIWSDVALSNRDCMHIAWMLQAVVFVGIVGTTAVQLVFALQLRSYANRLFSKEQAELERIMIKDGKRLTWSDRVDCEIRRRDKK